MLVLVISFLEKSFVGKFFFFPGTHTIDGQQLSEPEMVLIAASIFALLTIIGTTMNTLSTIGEEIEFIDLSELRRAKQALNT